jgi:hypothetical protein
LQIINLQRAQAAQARQPTHQICSEPEIEVASHTSQVELKRKKQDLPSPSDGGSSKPRGWSEASDVEQSSSQDSETTPLFPKYKATHACQQVHEKQGSGKICLMKEAEGSNKRRAICQMY